MARETLRRDDAQREERGAVLPVAAESGGGAGRADGIFTGHLRELQGGRDTAHAASRPWLRPVASGAPCTDSATRSVASGDTIARPWMK